MVRLDPKRARKRKALIELVKKNVPVILKQFPTLSKIWLIGSIAKPIFFDLNSDVDIVVDGLPTEKYFELYTFLQKALKTQLDLIMFKDITGENLEVLRKKVVIYEKIAVRSKTDSKKRNRFLSKKDRRT